MGVVWDGVAGDFALFRRTYHPGRPAAFAVGAFVAQPVTGALVLFRLSASPRKGVSLFFRRRLVRRYACDVERGAVLAPGLLLAHPVGIVIAGGVVIEPGVKLHQHVTLGTGRGGCPTLRAGTYVFPGAVVVGAITVGPGAVIGANTFVAADVPAGAVVPGGSTWI